MSCFWNGILKQIRSHQKGLPLLFFPLPKNPRELVKLFKHYNVEPVNVQVNGAKLSKQQSRENLDAVKNGYSENNVNNGTWVSTFDPILILLCELSKRNLHHTYQNVLIKYEYICPPQEEPQSHPPMRFCSNRGHFWS